VPKTIRFECYEVDLAGGQIYKRGARLHLPDQPFRVLASLLERPGQVVTREDLRRRLWPDEVFVDFDNVLNSAVARLRETLGDSADHPRFIETLPKRGYRFIAPVTEPVSGAQTAPARRTRLLVLPFRDWSPDAADEYLGDAMTDEVITELAALAPEAVAVIARTTAMRYKGTQKDVARIGRELGLDYLIEGAVRCAGRSVAVNAQLVRASDQAHVWAKKYESPRSDAFTIPGSVAQAIAGVLDISGWSGEATRERTHGAKRSTNDPIAYNEYVQGRHYLESFGTRDAIARSSEHLHKAIARDPAFALAHEALAQLYWFQGYVGLMAPRDGFAVGILHAVRALEIDSTRAEAYALLAQYRKLVHYEWPDIEREMTRARELGPASPLVSMLYSVTSLMPQGRIQEAIAELERAAELDPLSAWIHTWLAIMFALARDPDSAAEQGRLLIELDAGSPWGHWALGFSLRAKGLADESIAAHQKAVDLSNGSPMMLGWLGLVLGAAGRLDEARHVLERLQAMSRSAYVPPTSFAWLYLGLRQVDAAFEWLDRAVDACDQVMMPIKSYQFFDPIRSDPRFAALLRKMKLQV
jgi:TolB-like protein/tetratricopeptide (TPR) repeat protein